MLKNLKKFLLKEIPKKISEHDLNSYENFGKMIEDHISDIIEEYLRNKKIKFKSYRAPNKNYFPDLTLTIRGNKYALEYKCGLYNKSGTFITEPANDLGTLNSYTKKIDKFNNNIFCIFVKYSIDDKSIITIDNIYIDYLYKFVGRRNEKSKILTKYREKDGNLRPKNWEDFDNSTSYFNSLEEFRKALLLTQKYRSLQLILKNLETLSTDELLDIKASIDHFIKTKQN